MNCCISTPFSESAKISSISSVVTIIMSVTYSTRDHLETYSSLDTRYSCISTNTENPNNGQRSQLRFTHKMSVTLQKTTKSDKMIGVVCKILIALRILPTLFLFCFVSTFRSVSFGCLAGHAQTSTYFTHSIEILMVNYRFLRAKRLRCL